MRDVADTRSACCGRGRLWNGPLLALAALGVLGPAPAQEPKSVRAVTSVDPYTEANPAAMAKAGYTAYAPFPFGHRHDTRDIMALLGDEQLLWIETAHFRIGCALSPLPLRGEADWIESTKEELKRLKTRLPKVKAEARELDPWLRTHLIAQRCEELYAEVQANLGVRDDTFPAAPGHDPSDPAKFFGRGPYLGLPQKYSVLIVSRVSSLARYTRAHQGHETELPRRYFDLEYKGMVFAVAEETSAGLMKNDFALHTHLVYNLSYTLYTAYRWFGHDLPPWLVGGLAHWHGRRICPRFPAYERQRDDTNLEQREFWRWDERAPGLLRNGAFESIEALMRRPTMTEFGMEQHIQSWAFVDFLMATRKAATMRFLHEMKDPFHNLRQQPSQEELLARAKVCLARAFGVDAAGLEAAWKTQLLRARPKK
ncbi:MAG TPA: hypothetical protein VFT55_08545 [Planctomycetota bacterium]|nr:hypothetical protein [Planctomycetota bacterium]